MNPAWFKKNLVLVIVVAVFVILMGAVVWLQQKSASVKGAVEEQLAIQEGELERLRGTKPAPSSENLKVLRSDREQLEAMYGNLVESVSHGTLQAPDLRPVEFSQMLAQKLGRLRQSARAASVKIPEDFSFGFSRYLSTLPARSLPEADAQRALKQLTRELLTVEKLSDLLFANRIDEIRAIRRAEVEPGGTGTDALTLTINDDPEALFQSLPFEFEFVCTTETLRSLLNSLSKSDWFFAVRTLSLTTEAIAETTAGTTASGEAVASAPARNRLVVKMRIDLIEFPKGKAQPAT